jgi:hypothetical protein
LFGVISFAALTSCAGSTDPARVTIPSHAPFASLQGKAYDVVSLQPVGGMVLTLGEFTTITDISGSYQFNRVSRGSYTLSGNVEGYEPFSTFIELGRDVTISVALRRTRPFVKDFRVTGTIIYGTLVHLPGASTLDRDKSTVDDVTPSGTIHISLAPAFWTPIDATSVRVTLDTGKLGISRVSWSVRDAHGVSGRFVCRGDGNCAENQQ